MPALKFVELSEKQEAKTNGHLFAKEEEYITSDRLLVYLIGP